MNKPKKPEGKTLTAQLLWMIYQSGMTTNALALAAGVPQPVLHRFYNGDQASITLRNVDKLCAFFGVRLTAPRKRKPAAKGKS